MRASAGRPPFVGRQREIGALAERLAAAAQGRGGVVLVSGEPGIGKTRLLLELEERARTAGWRVLTGRAYDSEGMPPYLPWVEALRTYVRTCPPAALQAQLGDGAALVALLVPAIRRCLPDLPPTPDLSPEHERYSLFESVTDFLLAIARQAVGSREPGVGLQASHDSRLSTPDSLTRSGLLLVLDDLHWADRPTLLLLQHLARKLAVVEVPLVVAGAYRAVGLEPAHPLTETLADLVRERLVERLSLGSFSAEEAAALIAGLTGAPPATAVVEAIERDTEGNPFFVEEVVRHLMAEGRDLSDPRAAVGDWGIPEGVREVVGARLVRLSPAARAMLQAGAVLGEAFTFDLVRSVSGVETGALLDAFDEALRAGMVREERDGYSFTHALIRQTLYDELNLSRRQQLHLRAAEAIEAAHRRHLQPHLAALSAHYRLAGAMADPEKVIEFLERAGDAAAAVFAWEDARDRWQTALEVMERHGIEPARRAKLLERLGDLAYFTGLDYETGIRALEEALAQYEALGEREQAARLHLRLGQYLSTIPVLRDIPRALAHHRAAEAVVGTGSPAAACELYLGLGAAAFFNLRMEEALAASRRARELAEQVDDPALRANAAGLDGYHLLASGRLAEGRALLEGAYAAADRLEHVFIGFLAAVRLGYASRLLGDPRDTQRWCLRELAKPRLSQAPDPRGTLLNLLGSAYAVAGELDAARRLPPEAGRLRIPTMLEADLAVAEGDWERAATVAAEQREVMRRAGDRWLETFFTFVLARVHRLRGEERQAETLFAEGLAIAVEGGCVLLEMRFRPELALSCVAAGRGEEAAAHVARCRTVLSQGEDWRGLAGRVRLVEGALTALEGRLSTAEQAYTAAIDTFRRYGLVWDEAEAWQLWGATLQAARVRAAAAEKFEAAAAVYRRHGAGLAFLDRLRALQGQRLPHGPEIPTYPDGLTQREVDVLRLVAGGRTSREIAESLVLSPRTVDRHIANIYAKIGAHGKADAVAYALRHNLAAST